MTTSTSTGQNLLEKIGMALVGVRLSNSGMDEGEAEFIIERDLTTGKEVADFVATMSQLQTPLQEGAL